MGHTNVPLTYSHTDKGRSSRVQSICPNNNDRLNNALGAIRVLGMERSQDDLAPHLNTVLSNMKDGRKGTAEQVVISGILPILALSLKNRGPLTVLTAKLVAELAKEPVVRKGFNDAGLITALLSVLISIDQELLILAARAISRMSYDSFKQQELLLRQGVVPRLVAVLFRFPEKEALEEVCLQALCNLGGIGVAEEAGMVWERGVMLKPGETVFHGVSPHTCGFASSVIHVRVSQWAPGQCTVNFEVFQRCSSSFWLLHANKAAAGWSPFSGIGACSSLYKLLKAPAKNIPNTKSLKTRMFHTLL